MSSKESNEIEDKCSVCKGTGFEAKMQPQKPVHTLAPLKCPACVVGQNQNIHSKRKRMPIWWVR